nr:MAG TPA: hypothetical protein [Caudoviricetes sp.]
MIVLRKICFLLKVQNMHGIEGSLELQQDLLYIFSLV